MRRSISYLALLMVVALVGCSGDSPRPAAVPTVVPDAWSITSLTSSSSGPFVNTVILIEATVTQNGAQPPDGTKVNFLASGGAFASGTPEANVLTENGKASVAYVATAAGTYVIQAQVESASRQISVEYEDRATSDELQLFGISPRRGSYAGGEEVVITGKGILSPVDVFFDLNGQSYQGITAGVAESDPPSEEGSVTVITPAFTGENNSIQQAADVRVLANAGTGSQDSDTLGQAFVLVPGGGPIIYGLSPSSGRSSGGEIVNVLGQGFGTVAADIFVSFTDEDGVVKLANVLSVAPDGSQIQIETPQFSTLPLSEDRVQDVNVSTIDGTTVLDDGFLVLADNPEPEIASLSPIAGPLDGGTLVTIFGSGFQIPMQVTFGNLTATDVNVFNDTTPADNDRITCIAPDYSQQDETPPIAVDVVVTNMTSGNDATAVGGYTYGDALFVSGNTPSEAGVGDLVIIYGSGFEDPLQVFFPEASTNQLEVVSVSGTELVVRIPEDMEVVCTDVVGQFKVLLLESNLEAIGGAFTVLGNSPLVLSSDPVIFTVDNIADRNVTPDELTITGEYFSPNLLVSVGSYLVPSGDVDVLSSTSIDVFNLPNMYDMGVSFATTSCIIPGPPDVPGQQLTSTPVNLTVRNFPGDCSNTLVGALFIEPPSTTCDPTPANIVTLPQGSMSFPDTPVGGPVTQPLDVFNIGGETATGISINLVSGIDFSITDNCPPALPYGPATPCTVQVTFDPVSAGAKTDSLVIGYNSASEGPKSEIIALQGTGTP